jgi:GNAT superfamily N-acetyltransferase
VRIGVVDERLTRELRRAVLRPELPPGAPLPGDELDGGVHFGAIDNDGTVLCTCFVYPDPCPWRPDVEASWHLRQMATVEGARGRGIGAAVLSAAVAYVAEHGFVGHGELFTDERHTIPHLRMYRELSAGSGSSMN